MSGTQLETEEQVETRELDPNAPPKAEEQDDVVTAVKVGDKELVPLPSLIGARKEAKALKAKVATLEQQLAGLGQVQQQLEAAAPILTKLHELGPEKAAQLIEHVRNGTAPSRGSNQPEVQDDPEARDLAEDLGLVDASGALDVARGRRMLDRLDRRAEAKARTIVQPFAMNSAAMAAANNRQSIKGVAADDGTPYATPESIDDAYAMLDKAPELAANPQVGTLLLATAMLIDKQKGRVPRAPQAYPSYGEPLLTEAPGGRRGAPVLDDAQRQILARVGLTEKEFANAPVPARGMGRGVVLE